jgi:hypothetical protein
MSVLWGLPMTGYLVYARGSMSLGWAVGSGVLGALLFGFGWAAWMRTGLLKMIRRLYAGDPALVPPPPPTGYQARLPASLMDGRIAVGGHLYVGSQTVCFVPHMKNLKAHRTPTELRFGATPAPEIVEKQPNMFQRLFRPGPIRLLRIGERDRAMTILVPQPDIAAEAIRLCLQ